MKKVLLYGLIGVFGLMAICTVLVIAVGDVDSPSPSGNTTTDSNEIVVTVTPTPAPRIAAEALYAEREANSERFDRDRKDTWVTVYGEVCRIESGSVHLYTDEDSKILEWCLTSISLDDLSDDELTVPSVGDRFEATCVVGNYILGTMFLKDCAAHLGASERTGSADTPFVETPISTPVAPSTDALVPTDAQLLTPTPAPTVGPMTTFGVGTWVVGVDIVAGTYSAFATENCYWARLSGFGGRLADIISNDNGTGPRIVEILASDAGFESGRGCGTWTLLEPSSSELQEPSTPAAALVQSVKDGIVKVEAGWSSSGSGFIFDIDGETAFVATNHHVIEDASSIDVIVRDSRTYEALVLGWDADRDVAVLAICCSDDFMVLAWEEAAPAIGSDVVAVGYPRGGQRGQVTATTGVIAEEDDLSVRLDFIPHTAPLNPGNSGGPLFSFPDGKVLGINTARGTQALSFYAVPFQAVEAQLAEWRAQLVMS